MSSEIAATVVGICREVLADGAVTLASTTADVKSWDSLGHMNLITALETHFGIELDVMAMAEVDDVRGLVALVAATLREREGAGA